MFGGILLHITLGPINQLDPETCPMGRSYNGWREGMSEEQIYNINRGRWVLGERADRERYALFSAGGQVRLAVGISAIRASNGRDERDDDGRRTLQGTVLTGGHPVHDTHVGHGSPVTGNRNPISYFDSPLDSRTCGCGCGEPVPVRRDFLAGHDQRAIHARIAKVGSVTDFLVWFDETWADTR